MYILVNPSSFPPSIALLEIGDSEFKGSFNPPADPSVVDKQPPLESVLLQTKSESWKFELCSEWPLDKPFPKMS